MLRISLLALATILVLSLVLVLRPIPAPPLPSGGVVLENVRLSLYPEQDPQARWEFAASRVEQDPSTREAKVTGLKSGERYVETRLDMRLSAPEVIIDRFDNLRVPYAKVEVLKGCYQVDLGASGEPMVEIDQRTGFKAPSVRINSPTVKVDAKDFRSDFAIESPSWGKGIDQFIDGEPLPCTIRGGSL